MPVTNAKTVLYTVPVASTSFIREPYWDGRKRAIRFQHEADGHPQDVTISFQRVAATRTCGEPYCTVWNIEECYDTLVEVAPSEWAEGTLRTMSQVPTSTINRELHHYMIYLDSVGCFEVLAKDWAVTLDEMGVAQ